MYKLHLEVSVPLNVSGVWYPVYDNDILKSGSIGLSLTLEPKLVVTGKLSDREKIAVIRSNGDRLELDNFGNLLTLKKLGTLSIDVYSEVPLGYGYGMSGAISLGYAMIAYELGLTDLRKALLTAHESEVLSKNGLGDVISEYYGGGIVYRKKPGAPTIGEVEIFTVTDDVQICSLPESRLSTSLLLKTNEHALNYINQFLLNPTIHKFFEVAKKFTEELGFISPYKDSFKKKGLILKLGECEEGWIKHKVARSGVSVH